MNSSAISYKSPSFIGLTRHDSSDVSLIRDTDDTRDQVSVRREIDVQIRSGDYFVTLATELDSLSRSIDSYGVRVGLEDIVSDLIYLQDSYTIIKNKSTE
jgi:hypothetical protein